MAQILKITNEFSFFASHRLDCIGEEAHSHDYKFQVSVTGSLDKNDMVIDFLKLQKIVQEVIIASLENKLLNDIIPNPTAENVTLWIWINCKKN